MRFGGRRIAAAEPIFRRGRLSTCSRQRCGFNIASCPSRQIGLGLSGSQQRLFGWVRPPGELPHGRDGGPRGVKSNLGRDS
jgi:hypothetical protein